MVNHVKYTVVLLVGKTIIRAVGIFDTKEAAELWAKDDGWPADCFKVVELWP